MGDKDIDDFEYVETNQCISAKHSTPFGLNYDMDQMKDMVRDADPGTVNRVAAAWDALSKDLVGPGGIKESLDAAVEHVLAHWEGQSADLFRQRAQVISKKLTDSSKYASHTSTSLKGAAATLAQIKPEIMAMEKPGKVSSALDYIGNMGDRDDSGANNALKSGESSQAALDGNAGSLSEGREAQLRMAVKMEALGAAYNSRAAEMGQWRKGNPVNDREDYPGEPGGVAPAPVVVPAGTATASPRQATAGTARTGQVSSISSSKAVSPPSGITGGAHKPTTTQPQVGTAIDGIAAWPNRCTFGRRRWHGRRRNCWRWRRGRRCRLRRRRSRRRGGSWRCSWWHRRPCQRHGGGYGGWSRARVPHGRGRRGCRQERSRARRRHGSWWRSRWHTQVRYGGRQGHCRWLGSAQQPRCRGKGSQCCPQGRYRRCSRFAYWSP